MSLDPRLKQVFASVFGVKPATLSGEDSPDTINGWDSINHLQLMLALEAEFGVQFDADELAGLISIGAIQERLARR